MAFNVGNSKQAFNKLKSLSVQKRMEAVSGPDAATILTMLTPVQFAELFPDYYRRALPDVGGFREAITKRSRQKQDDINFGLSQGAKSIEQAEQMGSWRRRLGGDQSEDKTTSSVGSSRIAHGSLATNQREAYKAAIAEGLSPSAAKILVANMSGESLKNPSDHHYDVHHMSQGIVQWDPSRAEIIKNKFGAYPKDMTVAQQTKAAIWEMKTYYGKSYAALTNEGLSAEERLHTVVADYERPQNVSSSVATRMGYLKGLSLDAGGGGAATGGSGPDFSKYIMSDKMNGRCGEGTRKLAGHMFGNSYFFEKGLGEGGDAHAGSLSSGNRYFQSSGMYASGKSIGKDALTQDYLNSLPIGSVVSSQGGSRGGHVQIKIGPNQWASDGPQGGAFYYGNGYDNFVVHQPNEAGLAMLSKNGVVQPGELPGGGSSVTLGQSTGIAAQQTVAAAAPAPRQPDIPQEIPDSGQSATVSKPEKDTKSAAKTFNVNRQALIGTIKQTDEFKNTFGSSLASDDMIYNGFFDDARTKKLMADTQSSFDPNTGTVKIGNYDAFKKSIGMDTSKILQEVPSDVPSHAGGGRERVKGPLHMRHLHHQRRGDTALVTDARGKQFTVNPKKESMTLNPQTGIMDIKPQKSSEQMDIEKLMAIIRRQESGSFAGDYNSDLAKKAKPGKRHDTASGAYQFNNKTWKGVLEKELNMPHILKQYPRAVHAPKEVQDQVMKARIEKWRASGHSDNEIILHHFTGNKEGRLSASAQKGNPTPAEYRAQIASHKMDYERMNAPQQPAKTEVAKAAPAPTQPAPKAESMVSKLASPLKSLIDPGSAAAETVKAAPAPEAPKGSVDFAPATMDENWFKNQQPASQIKTELPPDRPQSPIVMNPAETRPAHMQPTPSLARAMDNARGVTDSGYTGLTGTKLGGK